MEKCPIEREAAKPENILLLPSWYPHQANPLFGIFFKKLSIGLAQKCKVSVLYPCPVYEQDKSYLCSENSEGRMYEVIVYYRKSSLFLLGSILNVLRRYNAVMLGYKKILKHSGKPQLVYAQVLNWAGIFAFILRLKYRLPYILGEHWSGYMSEVYRKSSFLYKWLAQAVVNRAAALTAVSEQLKESMIKNRLNHSNFFVIPNIIDVPEPKITKSTPGQACRIIFIGDLVDEVKNVSGILHAMSLIVDEQDFEFHIFGDGIDGERLKSYTQNNSHLSDCVHFHGTAPNNEILDFIGTCDFLVLNSRYETFSVVVVESLACGKPVVATKCGGPENMINDQTGLLVPVDDVGALKEALVKMINTHRQYDGKFLRQFVMQRYASEVVVNQVCGIIKQVSEANN